MSKTEYINIELHWITVFGLECASVLAYLIIGIIQTWIFWENYLTIIRFNEWIPAGRMLYLIVFLGIFSINNFILITYINLCYKSGEITVNLPRNPNIGDKFTIENKTNKNIIITQ